MTTIETSEDAQVRISWNGRLGRFAVTHYCRYKWPFSSAEVGQLDRWADEVFKSRGLALIAQSLVDYPKRQKTGPSEIESLPQAEQHHFHAEYRHLLVTLWENRGLLLQPLEPLGTGGFGTMDTWATRLEFPISSEQFYLAVGKAFSAAEHENRRRAGIQNDGPADSQMIVGSGGRECNYAAEIVIELPGNIGPVERGRRFRVPIDEALARAGLGKTTGGESVLGTGQQPASVMAARLVVGTDSPDKAICLLRALLPKLGCPGGTKLIEGERVINVG